MRALATGPRVALAADARRDAHHRVAREVAAAAAPRRHVVGARRDAHARSPGPRARWPPPRALRHGPSRRRVRPSGRRARLRVGRARPRPRVRAGSRALDASRLDARGRVPVGARTVILGIETSCDDTGAAVVTGDGRVLGEALASQGEIHARWGGRAQPRARGARKRHRRRRARGASAANVSPENLSAVAVTVGPGLSMCLRVGVVKAQDLCHEHGLPIVPVHHMEAHALPPMCLGDGATANESNDDADADDADDDDDVDDARSFARHSRSSRCSCRAGTTS